jgi:hypothetical protein
MLCLLAMGVQHRRAIAASELSRKVSTPIAFQARAPSMSTVCGPVTLCALQRDCGASCTAGDTATSIQHRPVSLLSSIDIKVGAHGQCAVSGGVARDSTRATCGHPCLKKDKPRTAGLKVRQTYFGVGVRRRQL